MKKFLLGIIMLFSGLFAYGQCSQTDIQQSYITFSTNEHITVSEAIYSLSDTVKVKFALGNLMYQPSTNTWKIADEQYDFVGGWWDGKVSGVQTSGIVAGFQGTIPGSYNTDKSKRKAVDISNYDGWIDLFKFATADTIHITVYRDIAGRRDTIIYRTPTAKEYDYLIYKRKYADQLRGRARITFSNDKFVNGMIILPDTNSLSVLSDGSVVIPFIPGGKKFVSDKLGCKHFEDNKFDSLEWKILEAQGIIFLPTCGSVGAQKYNRSGFYWTGTKTQNGNGEDRGTTMEFGGYSNTSNDLPIFVQREIVNERRGIRLCYEIHSDD